ncbi:hypothetical protein SEVIR_5G326101v4 [Setaria viridis]
MMGANSRACCSLQGRTGKVVRGYGGGSHLGALYTHVRAGSFPCGQPATHTRHRNTLRNRRGTAEQQRPAADLYAVSLSRLAAAASAVLPTGPCVSSCCTQTAKIPHRKLIY